MFFLVPLSGDIIETLNGVKHTVLSYAPHKDQPAVYVDVKGSTEPVHFSDIAKLNGIPVELGSGQVFLAGTKVDRTLQLPQRMDKIVVDGIDDEIKVKSLKLRDRGDLSKGMLIVGVLQDTKDPITVPLSDIVRIRRASGDEQFTRRTFTKLYADYLGYRGKTA